MNFRSSVNFIEPREINRDAPLFVYLPGMDGTGKLLQRQSNNLAANFDLRCLSIRIDNHSTWSDLARDTVQLIKSELTHKTNSEVYLCGESFGGCLALKTALAAPSVIKKLILVNPASTDEELRNLNIPSLIVAGAADDLLPSVEEAQKLTRLLPQAQMTVLPQSGHACLLENEINLYQILVKQNFIPAKYALC